MELAMGLGFEGLQLTAFAVNQMGDTVGFSLKDLYKRGLPTCAKPTRRRIDTNLADWRVINGQSYLKAFGFTSCQATEINHQFFEVLSERRIYIFPALALMRALFRPTKHLLPEMFMPQALDRQCRLAVSAEGTSVFVDAPWATTATKARRTDWMPLFSWMMAHTSANNMAGSIHANAMIGRFGLELPTAEMRIVFRGLKVDSTVFVTEVSVVRITTHEKPSIKLLDLPSTFSLFSREVPLGKTGTFGSLTSQFTIPRHKTGEVALKDHEWVQIEPLILTANQTPMHTALSQREILNGILEKLATGAPWKQITYTTGTWTNAYSALRRWAAKGVFQSILRVLEESRDAPQ